MHDGKIDKTLSRANGIDADQLVQAHRLVCTIVFRGLSLDLVRVETLVG